MENDTHNEGTDRPLGYWLRVVDAGLDRAFADALAGSGADRRDWMLLNLIDRSVRAPWISGRGGKRLRRLEERGWIAATADGYTLTEEGRAEKERLSEIVEGIRTRVATSVSAEDFATTLASLEAIARELGWDEEMRMPHRRFGRDFGPGFGPAGFGPGFRPGFGPGHGHGHSGRSHRRADERAYERGFAAGFAQGRTAA